MNNAKRKDMFEPISEEFYKELWSNILPGYYEKSLQKVKEKGYVKQSYEEEIRKKIKDLEDAYHDNKNIIINYQTLYTLQSQLIIILDNQIKELKK